MYSLCSQTSRQRVTQIVKTKTENLRRLEKLSDGRVRVRFKTVTARKTPTAMGELIEAWRDSLDEQAVHPAIAMAAMNLDFLCIHPFRDGNGRVSRLLFALAVLSPGV